MLYFQNINSLFD